MPKGDVITDPTANFVPGIRETDPACDAGDYDGLSRLRAAGHGHRAHHGFTWADAAVPDVTDIAGGRRQIALSFDQDAGTMYDIYRVVDGVVQGTPFVEYIRGQADDVQVVVDRFPGDYSDPIVSAHARHRVLVRGRATRQFPPCTQPPTLAP